ncbi:hypothetical protein pb186bvf_012841 [Paramecium bursaria]
MIIFVLLGIVHSAGVKVEGKIHKQMGKIFIDDPKIQVTLNHGQFEAIPQTNGDFAFYNVPYGRYFLEVQSTNYIYTAAIIDVYSNKVGSPGISVVKYHPINRQRLVLKQQDINRKAAYSMIFEPIEKIEYFEVKTFNIYIFLERIRIFN